MNIQEEMKMHIIKDKEYDFEEEKKKLNFVSYNSKGTLSFVMEDGTHYNFNNKEFEIIIDFISKLNH